ncbi:MAG: hypothetical protein WBB38_10640 [Hyphomicrobiaceae bacterium]|jgi:hypothetical protein
MDGINHPINAIQNFDALALELLDPGHGCGKLGTKFVSLSLELRNSVERRFA